MLRRLAALAVLALGGCSGARTAERARPPHEPFALAVPFEAAGGLLVVDVAIAGVAAPQRFVVDTGAGTTVISNRLHRALGLPLRGHIEIYDAADVAERTPMVRLRALELGGVRFTDVGAAVIDLDEIEQNMCTRIDGILGTNVFRHGVLELDYPGAHVRLPSVPARLPERGQGEPLALVASWMPYLAVERGGETVATLLLDSGSAGALSLPSTLREAIGVTQMASGEGLIGIGAHGAVRGSKHAFAWPEATIGGRSFFGVDTIAHDTGTGTLGARVLRSYVVRIDYRDHTARLWPTGAALPQHAGSFGFDWLAGAAPEVSFVWAGSAAQRAGIAPGQPITAIDGQPLAALDDVARCELARDMSIDVAPASRTFEIAGRTHVLQREPLVPTARR